jgi:hypothetical protein
MDPIPLFFVLGVIARLMRSDLRLPPPVYDALSIYLLLAIGLKGGVEMARSFTPAMVIDILVVMVLGAAIVFVAYPIFRRRLGVPDAASLAAHYGSISIVTFAAASQILTNRGISYEPHLSLLAAVMEAPALLVGAWLGRRNEKNAEVGSMATLLHEIAANRSVLLLIGGIAIGVIAGPEGKAPLQPLFVDLFKGALCLFLLEMGLVAAGRFSELRRSGLFLILAGIGVPLLSAVLGAAAARLLGFSQGGCALLMTLAASASYIAAPTAMRLALPKADPAIGITAALAITFPFNLLLGIPLYIEVAGWLTR